MIFGSSLKISERVDLCLPLIEEPVSLDPRYASRVYEQTFMKYLFEGLTRETPEGYEPGLAREINVSNDYKTYTFKLRRTFWSNGDPLTTEDVIQSWQQVLSSLFPKSMHSHFEVIKNASKVSQGLLTSDRLGLRAPDSETLIVELEYPEPLFAEIISKPMFLPVHRLTRESYEHSSSPVAIFNGPFFIKEKQTGHKIILVKNNFYWDTDNVALNKVSFFILNNVYTTNLLFEKNELDFQGQPLGHPLPRDILLALKKSRQLQSFDVNGTFWITFNLDKEGPNDPNLRKALAFSIDKQKIIDTILLGEQKQAHGLFPGYDFSETETKKNPLIYRDKVLKNPQTVAALNKLSLIYPSNLLICARIAQALQQQWKEILGWDVPLKGMEYQSFIHKKRKKDFTLSTGGWICMNRHLKHYMTTTDGYSILSHWKNAEFLKLSLRLNKETEEREQQLIAKLINDILNEELPIYPIYHYKFNYATKKGLYGIRNLSSGTLDFKYASWGKPSSNVESKR